MRQILIGGGASSLVFGNLSRKLNKANLKVEWHVSDIDGGKYTNLPAACEGVIILRDMIGHTLFYSIVAEAKKQGIPLAAIPRKWSHAEPILRLQGFLPDAHPLKKAAPQDVVLQTAVFYLDRERDKGRVPKIDEVEAVVRKTLGPKSSLSQKVYKAAVSQSAAVNAQKQKPIPPSPSLKASEVGLWVETVLEEHPEKSRNARKLATEMIKENGNIPQASQLVEEAVAKVKKRWNSRLPADRKWRNEIIHKWLVRWFQRALEGLTKFWPTYSESRKQSKRIFDVMVDWAMVQTARAEVIGEWAYDIGSVNSLALYYAAKHPLVTSADLQEAIDDGRIPSVTIPSGKGGLRQYTSERAIDDYLAGLKDSTVTEPPAAPKPEPGPPAVDPAILALVEATRSLQEVVVALTERVTALETPSKGPSEVSLDFGELLSRLPSVTIKIELHPPKK